MDVNEPIGTSAESTNFLRNLLKDVDFELTGCYLSPKVLFYIHGAKPGTNSNAFWYGPEQERLDVCKLIPEVLAKTGRQCHRELAWWEV